ncbi:LicD family protein [Candidatus Odyssella thessalonicensis]|uniref:LicD family protein n=1 Tax=Candidatus Odyssella thessalonicensis TaxID=84647 RepID=UPI000225ABE6|nr:LicD family protein [Candidatus Odyssella thessalonicensis]
MYWFSKTLPALLFNIFSLQAQDTCINLDQAPEAQRQEVRQMLKTDPNLVLALYQVTYDVSQLLDHHNIPYSAAFGTLLGMQPQRSQGILPHDDDVDLMFDNVHAEKLLSLKKVFWELGYNLFKDPENIVGFKVYSRTKIRLTNGKEVLPFIDLFEFYLDSESSEYRVQPEQGRKIFHKARIAQEDFNSVKLWKFGAFELKGLTNAAPFLNSFYGPAWKDIVYISHKHNLKLENNYLWRIKEEDRHPAEPTGPLKERVRDFLETGVMPAPLAANNYRFWNSFYSNQSLELSPSTFAKFLVKNNIVKPGAKIVDIACGNGRDTFYFMKNNLLSVGIDASDSAIETNRGQTDNKDAFQVVDINDHEKLKQFVDCDYFYARFFIHSISEAEQRKFMSYLRTIKAGAKLLLEFRTQSDPMFKRSMQLSKTEGVTDHYRRYINFTEFCAELEAMGFRIEYRLESDGLSVRGDDNPALGRIVASKQDL